MASQFLTVVYFYTALTASQTFFSCKPSTDLEEVWEDNWDKKLGHCCDGEWPFYAGGFGPTPRQIKLNTHWKISDCLTISSNAYCNTWIVTEYSNSIHFGAVNLPQEYCTCVTPGASYCNSWACRNIDNLSQNVSTYTTETCDTITYDKNTFDVSCFTNYTDELLNCWCLESNVNQTICNKWYCEEYEQNDDRNGYEFDHGGLYGCYPKNSNTCDEWYGYLVDEDERKDTHCFCNDIDIDNNAFCRRWSCKIQGVFRLRLNENFEMFWTAFIAWVVLFGVLGTYVFIKYGPRYLTKGMYNKKLWVFYFVYWAIIGVACIVHGGIPAFALYCLCTWIECGICFCVSRLSYATNQFQDTKTRQDTTQQPHSLSVSLSVKYETFH